MPEYRTIKRKIKSNHPYYNNIVEFSHYSNNLYNRANFIVRQNFFNNKIKVNGEEKRKYLNNMSLNKIFKENKDKDYYSLPPATSICITKDLHKNWMSFFKLVKKDSKANPPKYKKSGGKRKFNFQSFQFSIVNNTIVIMKSKLNWVFDLPEEIYDYKIKNIEFIPEDNYFIMLIRYEIEDYPIVKPLYNNVATIDLGLNNLIAIGFSDGSNYLVNGKGLKSKNSYYNHKIGILQSEIMKVNKVRNSKRIRRLWQKRSNIMLDYLHKASSYVVKLCVAHGVDTVIIGHNKNQKKGSKLKNFVQVPIFSIMPLLEYKLRQEGISLIEVNESYTSGTSYLDKEKPNKKNYNLDRKITRGLFRSNKGVLVNSDINGAYQILHKVKEISEDVIWRPLSNGFCLNPVKVNL